MRTNKELKRSGLRTVRTHYLLLLMLCVIAVFFGNEFSANTGILNVTDLIHPEQATHQTVKGTNGGSGEEPDADVKHPVLRETMSARIGLGDHESAQVVRDILNNDLLGGIQLAEDLEKQFESSGTKVVGHTEGVLAYVVNTVSSGTLAIRIFEALDKITGSDEGATIAFVLLGLALYTLFGVCVPEIYAVVLRRMFLEARVYEKVPLHHAMHLLKVRRCIRATLTIIRKDIQYYLWCLTIAGIFIKRYSYYLVPYIVAENPDIRPGEAIALSRRMMNGHKLEAFKFELSFLHWILLGILTMGLSNVFFYLPYKIAATTEYYACVRQMAKEEEIEGAALLDDAVLLAKADPARLQQTYRDTAAEQAFLQDHRIVLTGARRFFAQKLAIWLGRSADKAAYQTIENREYRLREALQAMDGQVYPVRLDPRADETNRHVSHQINFLRCYTIWNLLFMFLLFAFIGWIWEVTLFLIQTGQFVNRGTLHGPWVPIYGVGGALIIVVLSSLRKRPLTEFFAIIVLCGTIEYFTSWALEQLHGMRWWDYSGYFLNLDGRICAEGLIAFGVLGMMAIYLLAPALDTLLSRIDPRVMTPLTSVLMAAFLFDAVYSQFHLNTGTGITDMGRQLRMTQVAALPGAAGRLKRTRGADAGPEVSDKEKTHGQ